MGFTPDELPLIGALDENEYIAAGFHGHGMPKSEGYVEKF
jgi:glycine/D-amino acid oxidase-like deaminating enzyme